MGKSQKQKQQVSEYRLSIHFGGVARTHALRAIYVDDKRAWSGRQVGAAALSINEPDLFGGPKEQGGLLGTVHYLPGGTGQVLPAPLAARLGGAPTAVPNYRSFTSFWFVGNESSQILGDFGQGLAGLVGGVASASYSASTGSGFTWSANNPIIAQTVDSVWEYCPTADEFPLNDAHARIPNPEAPDNWPDANPAHIIYAILADPIYGIGRPQALINAASFRASAETLFNEGFGLSLMRTAAQEAEEVIKDVLDHISASLYDDPTTGLTTLKLFRDDYDANTIPVLNPDNSRLLKATRNHGPRLTNEIKVQYTNPVNEEQLSLTRQNLASFDTQGAINSADLDFYAIRRGDLAAKVCERELVIASAPLLVGEFAVVDPALQVQCFIGAVLRVAHPERGVDGVVVRVLAVTPSTASEPEVLIEVSEDIFSLKRPPILSPPPPSQWVPPDQEPEPVAHTLAMTTPYYWDTPAAGGGEWPIAHPFIVAGAQSGGVIDYDLIDDDGTAPTSVGVRDFCNHAPLAAGLSATATTIPKSVWSDPVTGPTIGKFLLLADEVLRVSGETPTDWVVDRGLLDTIPKTHATGASVWVVAQPDRFVERSQERVSGEEVDYRLLSRTPLGQLPIEDAPLVSLIVSSRPHRPLRPANPRLNGVVPGGVVPSAATWVITWATRNRLLEDGQPVVWSAPSVTPEFKQRTIVQVRNSATSAVVYEDRSLWTQSAVTLQRSWFQRYTGVTISILSERDGLESAVTQSWSITGLNGDALAPLPPAGPVVPVAPSPVSPPDPADFTLATGATETPSLAVTGTIPPTSRADFLLLRYAAALGSGRGAAVPINDDYTGAPRPISHSLAPLLASTSYEVWAAYSEAGVASPYVSLGTATTGAAEATSIDGVAASQVIATLAAVQRQVDEARAQGEAARGEIASANARANEFRAQTEQAQSEATKALLLARASLARMIEEAQAQVEQAAAQIEVARAEAADLATGALTAATDHADAAIEAARAAMDRTLAEATALAALAAENATNVEASARDRILAAELSARAYADAVGAAAEDYADTTLAQAQEFADAAVARANAAQTRAILEAEAALRSVQSAFDDALARISDDAFNLRVVVAEATLAVGETAATVQDILDLTVDEDTALATRFTVLDAQVNDRVTNATYQAGIEVLATDLSALFRITEEASASAFGAESAFRSEISALSDASQAIVTQQTSFEARLGTAETSLDSLIVLSATTTGALVRRLDEQEASFGASLSAITSDILTFSDAQSALAVVQERLVAEIATLPGVAADLSSLREAFVDQTGSLARRLEEQSAAFSSSLASASEQILTVADANQAVTFRVQSLSAWVDTTGATAVSDIALSATRLAALARRIEEIDVRTEAGAATQTEALLLISDQAQSLVLETSKLSASIGAAQSDITDLRLVSSTQAAALARQLSEQTAAFGTALAGAASDILSVADANTALTTATSLLSARMTSAEGAIVLSSAEIESIRTAFVTATAAMARQQEELRASVSDSAAAARDDTLVLADATRALATRDEQLSAAILAGEGATIAVQASVDSLRLALATETAAFARRLEEQSAAFGSAQSGIVTELLSYADATTALSTITTDLSSRLGPAEAALSTLQQTVVTTAASVARQIFEAEARFEAGQANLNTGLLVFADAQQVFAERSELLTARMGGAEDRLTVSEAVIGSTATALATLSGAMSRRIDETSAEFGAALAKVQDLTLSSVDATQALATTAVTLDARLGTAESTITDTLLTLATTTASLSRALLEVEATFGTSTALARQDILTISDATQALTAVSLDLSARLGPAEALLSSLSVALATQTAASARSFLELEAGFQDSNARIGADLLVVSDANSATATKVESLGVEIDDVRASLIQEALARVTETAALVRLATEARAEALGNQAVFSANLSAAVDATTALAERSEVLRVRLDGAEGRLTSAEAAIVSTDSVLATRTAALARSLTEQEAIFGSSLAALQQERLTLADSTQGLATITEDLRVRLGPAEATLASLLEAYVTSTAASARAALEVEAVYANAAAKLTNDLASFADENTSLATFVQTLDARLGPAEALLTEVRTALATSTAASARIATELQAQIGASRAQATSEALLVGDANAALATRTQQLTASLANTNATLATESLARSTQVAALVRTATEAVATTLQGQALASQQLAILSDAERTAATIQQRLLVRMAASEAISTQTTTALATSVGALVRQVNELLARTGDTSARFEQQATVVTELSQAAVRYRLLATATGSEPAMMEMFAGPGGSTLDLVARALRFFNVSNGTVIKAMELVGGNLFLFKTQYIDFGGRRLMIGPGFGTTGNQCVLWFGPDTIAEAAATRTNGTFALGTDGLVYYGSTTLTTDNSFATNFTDYTGGWTASPSWETIATVTVTGATGIARFDRTFVQAATGTGDWEGKMRLTLDGTTTIVETSADSFLTGGAPVANGITDELQAAQVSVSAGQRTYRLQALRTFGSGFVSTSNTRLQVEVAAISA